MTNNVRPEFWEGYTRWHARLTKDGWSYGEEDDKEKKISPHLFPPGHPSLTEDYLKLFVGDQDSLLSQASSDLHVKWFSNRVARGWSWGEVLDEDLMTDPNLTAWRDLPSEERNETELLTFSILWELGIMSKNEEKNIMGDIREGSHVK